MRKTMTAVDISMVPEIIRLAEEVEHSGEPRLLKHGDRDVAILSPIGPQRGRGRTSSRRGRGTAANDPFRGIIGIGDAVGSPDDASDVATNKHKYLADAYDMPRT